MGSQKDMPEPVDIELIEIVFGEVQFETTMKILDASFKLVPVESSYRGRCLFKKLFRCHTSPQNIRRFCETGPTISVSALNLNNFTGILGFLSKALKFAQDCEKKYYAICLWSDKFLV